MNRLRTGLFFRHNLFLTVSLAGIGFGPPKGNQTILVWHALASKRRHIRDLGPELEALVTYTVSHESAMNRVRLKRRLG